ncbi:hypothetical protein BO78DRAFT_469309 [Aspergillus sclerotiicarbonarius CBS 121057]|uniref:Uncharacterized protein n=1 Tax=Aspergillus sclerotiicarbonarius (strain CBS 121057 / IBT 28362) TaxID=1448318 RepID=A0A319EKS9_ASPSB|nr:hypothetical protein BO78DRAFT_469309 [Aspergillus sclerotiicarbonarius CBS 121057]
MAMLRCVPSNGLPAAMEGMMSPKARRTITPGVIRLYGRHEPRDYRVCILRGRTLTKPNPSPRPRTRPKQTSVPNLTGQRVAAKLDFTQSKVCGTGDGRSQIITCAIFQDQSASGFPNEGLPALRMLQLLRRFRATGSPGWIKRSASLLVASDDELPNPARFGKEPQLHQLQECTLEIFLC